MTPTEVGRLFRLKLKRNHEARQVALASVRERPDRKWQARIGGNLRGRTYVYPTRRAAEAAVNEHYNEAMLAAIPAINGKGKHV